MQYVSEPLSRKDLRNYAFKIRNQLGYENRLDFPVMKFLEVFHELTNNPNFYFFTVKDDELPPTVHAQYDADDNSIAIKESVYIGASNGSGRDRMTIMHELAHALIITHCGIKLNRSFSNESIPAFKDPEWQAKCLAGELMIPAHLVAGMNAFDICESCGVSLQAAIYQLSTLKGRKR